MLQTIILLAVILGLFVLGIWMTFFGRRAFRFSGMIFGFSLGVGGALFAASMLQLAYDSLPVLIATPLAGLAFGLLGAFAPVAGAGLGGLCAGYLYGVGAVFTLDTLLNGALPSLLYTGISVAIVLAVFIVCLLRREMAKWLTTAFCGSYATMFALALALMWFTAGGFETGASISFLAQLLALYARITPQMTMFLLLIALFFGLLGAFIQVRAARHHAYDDLLDFDEPVDAQDGDDLFAPNAKPRRKRTPRNRTLYDEDDMDDEGDIDDADDMFADAEPKRARRTRRRDENADLADMDIDPAQDSPPKATARVATVQQAEAADAPPIANGQTQVFRRVNVKPLSDDDMATKAPVTYEAPEESVPRQAPPKLVRQPSFTPRSQRRK